MKVPEKVDLARALQICTGAAEACAETIRDTLGRPGTVRVKEGPADLVTDVDRAAERMIVDRLSGAYPTFSVLSEETATVSKDPEWTWIIDPIDGTNNFVHGIPHVSVSVALAHRGSPVVGCIHDPLRGETYTAIVGDGAQRNGVAIHVSPTTSLAGAVVVVGFSKMKRRALRMMEGARALIDGSAVLRTTGSACLDLAFLACGRIDGMWYGGLSMWDVAAGMLLVSEAGGRVSTPSGEVLDDPEGGVAAANAAVHEELLRAIGARP